MSLKPSSKISSKLKQTKKHVNSGACSRNNPPREENEYVADNFLVPDGQKSVGISSLLGKGISKREIEKRKEIDSPRYYTSWLQFPMQSSRTNAMLAIKETHKRMDHLICSFQFLNTGLRDFVEKAIKELPPECIRGGDPQLYSVLELVATWLEDVVDHTRAFAYLDAGVVEPTFAYGNFWDPTDSFFYTDIDTIPPAKKSKYSLSSLQEDVRTLEYAYKEVLKRHGDEMQGHCRTQVNIFFLYFIVGVVTVASFDSTSSM